MTDKPIWAVDCETDPFLFDRVPEPFIWGAKRLFSDEYLEFGDTESFIVWAESQDAILYAHNGGKFDWRFIESEIGEFEPLMLINGRFSKFKIGLAEFRDSWNILPIPLATFRKTEFDYAKLEKDVREQHMPEIRAYLKDDCCDLGELLEAFIETHGVQLTQAGAAMKYWSKLTGIKPPKTRQTFFDKFSEFYYGGRVECFQPGIHEYEFVSGDINSAYPFAMQFQHPWGVMTDNTREIPETDQEIAACFIELTAKSTGAFPYRDPNKTGLSFPNDGKFRRFKITGWEYIAARDTDTLEVSKIHRVIEFMETIDFSDYVNDLYEKRKEAKASGDKARNILYKLLLNSLYGKFGANPDKYKEYMTCPVDLVPAAQESEDDWEWNGGLLNYGKMAVLERPLNDKQKRYFNVATAASITGYVRAMLWRAISASDGVLYCDTDCVMARDLRGVEFDSARLGAWDIEFRATFGAFAGKKLYALKNATGDTKKASKGVKISAEKIIRVAEGEEIVYENPAPNFPLKNKSEFARFIKRTVKSTKEN